MDQEREAQRGEFMQWTNAAIRCFGDKGDVEDITEGGST